ncbi:uncharacterized protein J4E79_009434 [Alternaria viburni]|uniref:uncharacterized protein n=1 Tax=Alternaria viburni TaxID=566460 RepID=UPI0020C2DC99|nr:uncharacterized protein J4E79_009434 [Alternaria viburni]KAI4650167.1 hypothetical protein J4E79_009434 [Alternaria viburni]KAI4704795.1 hypothetical protein J4E89_009672 [Alternaria sp. Ai002NY15]
MKFLTNILLFIAPIALALPTSVSEEANVEIAAVESRQSCYVKCGSTCYTSSQVSAARSAGYKLYQAGDEAGSSTYPHRYNNYEGFDFLVSGPYEEFPLRTSGAYTGGSPGADRVIFNTAGQRAGEITHTGASGNAFVACSGW